MSDLKKLKEIVEDHMTYSKASMDKAFENSDENLENLFRGEVYTCERILAVIRSMISEKE